MANAPLPEVPSLRVAATMHRGRPSVQQDAMWLAGEFAQVADMPPREFDVTDGCLLAIADGVASSPMPARASRLALQALATSLSEHPEWSFDGLVGTRHVRAAQAALSDALAARRLRWGASTTLVAAHIRNKQLAVVNSGDSRAYLVRASGEIVQLSKDHTELQRMIDNGEAQPGIEYASMYHALSDCLVADPEADDFAVHRATTELCAGDRLILCSDGVHDVLARQLWLETLLADLTPLQLLEHTRQLVLKNGAPDNLSMVVIQHT